MLKVEGDEYIKATMSIDRCGHTWIMVKATPKLKKAIEIAENIMVGHPELDAPEVPIQPEEKKTNGKTKGKK